MLGGGGGGGGGGGKYVPPPPPPLFGPTPPINCKIARPPVLIGLVSLHSWWDLRVSAVCVLVADNYY